MIYTLLLVRKSLAPRLLEVARHHWSKSGTWLWHESMRVRGVLRKKRWKKMSVFILKALASASKSGRWLLLKNVHLAPSWLGQLEKRLHQISKVLLTVSVLKYDGNTLVLQYLMHQIELIWILMQPHPSFRFFMTAEIHPKLPPSVLRASRVVVFEPATGLKVSHSPFALSNHITCGRESIIL